MDIQTDFKHGSDQGLACNPTESLSGEQIGFCSPYSSLEKVADEIRSLERVCVGFVQVYDLAAFLGRTEECRKAGISTVIVLITSSDPQQLVDAVSDVLLSKDLSFQSPGLVTMVDLNLPVAVGKLAPLIASVSLCESGEIWMLD